MRQPAQTTAITTLRALAGTAAASRLYLAQTLSARVARSEFTAEKARQAANEAAQAAEQARQAAATALAAANDARTAADAAYAQAAAAASAGSAAATAAATANERISVLEATDLYIVDGGSTIGAPAGTEGPMGELSIARDWGPFPLQVTLSAEVRPVSIGSGTNVGVSLGLRTNQRNLDLSNRTTYFDDAVTVELTYSFVPQAGETTIAVAWKSEFGDVISPAGRRQLSVLRIGTP